MMLYKRTKLRLITSFLAFFIVTNMSIAEDTIVFSPLSHTAIFELAKQENKPVFLYFNFDGCGACVKMQKTAFVDIDVADFYNENFICQDINTRKGEGIEINKSYNVKMHPTFLYLDENANLLHKIVGVFSPQEFILQAKNALSPIKSLSIFKEQYMQGKREPDFLFEYCYKLRDANELDSILINEYLATQSVKELSEEKNIRFIYEFAVHNGRSTLPFDGKEFNFLLENKDKFYNYFDPDQVNIRIIWIVNSACYYAIERQDEALFNKTIKIQSEFNDGKMHYFKEMDGRTTGWIPSKDIVLSSKIAYYDKAGDSILLQKTIKQYLDKIWDVSDALNSMAWDYYEYYDDEFRLETAIKGVIRSIELNSNYANNDTYAALLYKKGEYETALTQAKVAISIAKENNLDYQETTGLIEKIKEEMKK